MRRTTCCASAVLVLGAALLAAACGSDKKPSSGATTTAAGGATTTAAGRRRMPTGVKCAGFTIASFQALHRRDRRPWSTRSRTAPSWPSTQFNEKNPDCKISFENYDSQGDPAQARPWPSSSWTTRPSSASSARPSRVSPRTPARSSRRPACPPITPSATNAALSTNGWKTFHRILANDAVQGPGARQVHHRHAEGQEGLRHRRRHRLRQGPGRHRPHRPRRRGRRRATPSIRRRTDYSAAVTKVKAPVSMRCSSVATTPQAGRCRSSSVTPASQREVRLR